MQDVPKVTSMRGLLANYFQAQLEVRLFCSLINIRANHIRSISHSVLSRNSRSNTKR